MIISHKYKFIFVKTRKTGGTSLEVFLSQCCGDEDILTPIRPHVEPHRERNYKGIWNPIPEMIEKRGQDLKETLRDLFNRNRFYNHIPARIIRARVSNHIWSSYFKFCVERNPWDKTLSHYHMLNKWAKGRLSFDDYLRKGDFALNYPLYIDSKGELIVDKVIKYESLNEELAQIFEKLNVPFSGSLGVRAKSKYRTDRRPYQEVFSGEQREKIERAFAKEIALHGYQF